MSNTRKKIRFEVSPLGHRVYVPTSTWVSFVTYLLRRWGDVLRLNATARTPMTAKNTGKTVVPSKDVLEIVERWDQRDVANVYAVAFILQAGADHDNGRKVARSNGQLNHLLGYVKQNGSVPKVSRDVLEVHGWLERQSTGSNVGGVERASVYRLTIPVALFALMDNDPDQWMFHTDWMDELSLEVIDALEGAGQLPNALAVVNLPAEPPSEDEGETPF